MLVFCNCSFGQTISELDSKNGFKDFKIGDLLSKWQSNLTFDGTWDDGSKAYLYNGTCCNKVFDYEVAKTILRFKDNKLVGIYITTKKFQEGYTSSGVYTKWRPDDFESIKNSFTYLFGPPFSTTKDDKTGSIIHIWRGKKISLVSTYEYLGIMDGDRQQIVVLDNAFIDKGMKDGF
jgi:hypothetical protein